MMKSVFVLLWKHWANALNFYVPVFFDAAAVFGKPIEKLGPNDSFDVYANYDMDAGEVSEYLEILIKYWDGGEDTAMCRLSPEGKEMFQQKMDEYCIATMEQSLDDICQKHQQDMVQAM